VEKGEDFFKELEQKERHAQLLLDPVFEVSGAAGH